MIKQRPIEWLEALVEEIDLDRNVAMCIVKGNQHLDIPLRPRRGKGALPRPGERWLIDRSLAGSWSFSAVLNDQPIEITGSRNANPALAGVIDALEALGFVTDATTLGSAGGGGGVTDHGALTGLADDDHPQYLRQAEADDLYEPEGQAAAAVSAHVGASDPHTQYAKEADLGTAAAADTGDFIAASEKGAASGVAELDGSGLVLSAQLPSYVDDVIEAANYAALSGVLAATGKIYVTLDDGKTYRWSGSAFVEISTSLALGETSSTAYRGDRGKAAYDHSQLTSGNPHNVTKSDVGLGSVTNDAQVKASDVDTDSTMAANSASRVPSQSAAKGYTDQRIPTHRGATSFSGVYLSTKTGIVASAVVAGTAGSGRRIYVPIYLPAATYGSLAIVTTAAGTSTWRLGVYNHISGDQTIPGTVLLDAGTISTAGSTGVPTAITGLSIVIPADDWYYLAVQVDAYTTNPTVVAHAGASGQSTIPFLGWPEQRASYLRGFCGYQDWGVATGSLNTARSITNNTSTGLSYAQDVPRIWIGA